MKGGIGGFSLRKVMEKCSFCGNEVDSMQRYFKHYSGKDILLCKECYTEANNARGKGTDPKIRTRAIQYITNILDRNIASPDGTDLARELLSDEPISPQMRSATDVKFEHIKSKDGKIENAIGVLTEKTPIRSQEQYNKPAHGPDYPIGLLITGLVFAVLASILFFVSNQEVSTSSGIFFVANFQSTIYCGFCALISIVCFTGGAIVQAINRKS